MASGEATMIDKIYSWELQSHSDVIDTLNSMIDAINDMENQLDETKRILHIISNQQERDGTAQRTLLPRCYC